MMNISDEELISILEAIFLAKCVSVVVPPLENSRIYRQFESLWGKYGNEAISRGMLEHVSYCDTGDGVAIIPEDGLEEAESALRVHNSDILWSRIKDIIVDAATTRDAGDGYEDLELEQRAKVLGYYREQVETVLDEAGFHSLLNLGAIRKAPWL